MKLVALEKYTECKRSLNLYIFIVLATQLYHAGTPVSVEDHISKSMALDAGNVRVFDMLCCFWHGGQL